MRKLIMVYSCLFFLMGCVPHSADVKPTKVSVDFFKLSISERIKQFKNHTLEDQYELYLVGNQIVHPPAIYLAEPFAEQGPIVVPFLKKKLEVAKEEVTIRDISLVMFTLSQKKLYDFSKDNELMDLLAQRANNMEGMWKDITLKNISGIRTNMEKEPKTAGESEK